MLNLPVKHWLESVGKDQDGRWHLHGKCYPSWGTLDLCMQEMQHH